MRESESLRVGDVVWHEGSWGIDEARLAEVVSIEEWADGGNHRGSPVECLAWKDVKNETTIPCPCGLDLDRAVVDVVSGGERFWAYGFQLTPSRLWRQLLDD